MAATQWQPCAGMHGVGAFYRPESLALNTIIDGGLRQERAESIDRHTNI